MSDGSFDHSKLILFVFGGIGMLIAVFQTNALWVNWQLADRTNDVIF